ncbi:MAG: hypothetical protein LBS37_06670 [Treponema sp.]|jgi:hypothetical protein|nr:hypothetical protein [Treponema sp.]
MKKESIFTLVYLLLLLSGSVYGIGEKTITLGGDASWDWAEYRAGITAVNSVRRYPVLVLSSAAANSAAGGPPLSPASFTDSTLDLSLSFDEKTPAAFRDSAGRYRLTVSPALEAVDRRFARAGSGAALFSGILAAGGTDGPLVVEPRSHALFAPGSRMRDFTLEFWLYPLNMENGERVLSWISSRQVPAAQNPAGGAGQTRHVFQRIQCVAVKNRLLWSFADFFASPDGADHLDITVAGTSPVVPKSWSHHLIRFDSVTGMLEYLVNGKTEAIEYASSTGREGGEVYTPIAGNDGSFTLGRFMGIMDEFKIHSAWIANPAVQKYPLRGGRVETRAIDLGEGNSGVLKVEAAGGRTAINGAKINSEFRENGRFRFADDSEMQFFIRTMENPYKRDGAEWRNFTPGEELTGIRGRYVQIAADFYPSADNETSPFLETLRITYLPDEPPLPPASLVAAAVDGGVRLSWKNSPDTDTAGYLVYYGAARDDYFGAEAVQGASPVDAGKQNTILIDGLVNGTLYYFRLAAYDRRNTGGASFHAGEFSREVSARPLKGLEARSLRIVE